MKREEVLKALCLIVAEVGRKKFECAHPFDCLCESAQLPFESVHPEILDFIRTAVNEKLSQEVAQ